MSFAAKLKHELKAVGIATLYFGVWLGVLLAIKSLVLAELANTICLSGALLGYNMLTVIRRYLGEGGLLRLFMERKTCSR